MIKRVYVYPTELDALLLDIENSAYKHLIKCEFIGLVYYVEYSENLNYHVYQLGKYLLEHNILVPKGLLREEHQEMIVGKDYWKDHSIYFIKMLKKMTDCSLRDAKFARDELWKDIDET